MPTWDERFAPRPPAPLPRLEFVATLFRVQGASGRAMRCAVYLVATGTELRLEYEDTADLLRSQLFRVHNDEAIAELADQWHLALVTKGFTDLD